MDTCESALPREFHGGACCGQLDNLGVGSTRGTAATFPPYAGKPGPCCQVGNGVREMISVVGSHGDTDTDSWPRWRVLGLWPQRPPKTAGDRNRSPPQAPRESHCVPRVSEVAATSSADDGRGSIPTDLRRCSEWPGRKVPERSGHPSKNLADFQSQHSYSVATRNRKSPNR